jgi:hypothetical protein
VFELVLRLFLKLSKLVVSFLIELTLLFIIYFITNFIIVFDLGDVYNSFGGYNSSLFYFITFILFTFILSVD